jgi:hypothetical protein
MTGVVILWEIRTWWIDAIHDGWIECIRHSGRRRRKVGNPWSCNHHACVEKVGIATN